MLINKPDWNKDDYDREMEEYPDYEEEWNLEDSIQNSIWKNCIEGK